MSEIHYSNTRLRERYDQVFEEAYKGLNDRQKEAVDRIEGPVMVNAGPGTGKTQILAVRIGKILKEQDVAPHNILCLTYTDSATISMRKRLVEIVGPVAHKIHIYTFHAFCNQVIQENLDYFGGYKQLEPISELETVEVYRSIIDNIPDDNILKRFKGDRYFEHKRLKNLFDLMKKEDISASQMHLLLDDHIERMKEDEKFYAKRKCTNNEGVTFLKGDFRFDNYEKEVNKFDPLRAAIDLYPELKLEMERRERYDYNDMILWVVKAFGENPDLLAQYQERYLYFLVDEFQDTNGAQNHLLEQLISYWPQPNVFVVGDDDQAIYKFQGANLNNILDFKKKYDPHTVVLEENYRSNQPILDAARNLIEFNSERLVQQEESLNKNLVASGPRKESGNLPVIMAFPNISHEFAYLVRELTKIYKENPDSLKDTAIIYRKHKQVEDVVQVLEKKGIPLNIKNKVNILHLPMIMRIINILKYIAEEYRSYGGGHHRLFEILHYSCWQLEPVDIGHMAMACQQGDDEEISFKEWRALIGDKDKLAGLNLRNTQKIMDTSALLEKWIAGIPECTLQSLVEDIINESGILRQIMKGENRSWQLQVLSTFFDFIKNESARDPGFGLQELIDMIDLMNENKIKLAVNKIISSEKGVHFITAHSAKGLEFNRVFMIGCTKDIWDDNKRAYNQYKYPDNINADGATSEEDERRLFFVAMTRAEEQLFISYSERKEDGKELGASMYVDEVRSTSKVEDLNMELPENDLQDFYYSLLLKQSRKIDLIDHDLIDRWLQSYQMSVTHLNKYLACPLSFYFESILRIPHARNASSGFGSAVHHALWSYFTRYIKTGQEDARFLKDAFREGMAKYRSHFTEAEYSSYMIHGETVLDALYDEKKHSWFSARQLRVEEKISNVEYKGVPLKGFLDKVEVYDGFVKVIDYKTGNFNNSTGKLKPPNEKEPNGGDYWRQLVFYKILLDNDSQRRWNMSTGEIEYVEPDRNSGAFKVYSAHITPEDVETVGNQIRETYSRIRNHEFDQTCEDEDCAWCGFVKDNFRLNSDLISDEHVPE